MAKINSRQKGANGEREVAKILQQVVNEVALSCGYVAPQIRRNTEQSQIGGEDLTGLPWFSFEIKRCERVELDKWWQQTVTQAARKASGSSSWDALAKGGWKRLAGAGGGSVEVGGGTDTPAGEAARQGSREGQAGGPIDVGSAPIAGGPPAGPGGLDRTRGGILPPARFGFAGGVSGGPVASLPFGVADGVGGGLAGNQVPSPVAAFGVGGGSERSTVQRSARVEARTPVLLWRVNNGEWQARAWLTVLDANDEKIRTVADLSMSVWLVLFRTELERRLMG